MPRISTRQRVPQQLQQTVDSREEQARIRHLSSRYMERGNTYRKHDDRWKKLLYENEYLNDTEFLAQFRVTRDAFRCLLALVRDDPVYHVNRLGRFVGTSEAIHMIRQT